MRKRVILTLMEGSYEQGFPAILRISENNVLTETAIQIPGKLPPAPKIIEKFIHWQLAYNQILMAVRTITVPVQEVTNVSSTQLGTDLVDSLNDWLNSASIDWEKIRNELQVNLNTTDEIEILIETNNLELWQLPWHKWDLFEHYPKAEVALSKLEYQRPIRLGINNTNIQVRILAILGDSEGIDLSKDRFDLEQLSDRASVEFLLEPTLKEFHEKLWEQDWDILFFAGHSSSNEQGRIMLNKTDEITIDELKYALKRAIDKGLRLTIFNSCDGLRLGQELLELDIPQVIVMREPVPDVVAQAFLKYFLTAFVGGQSLYASVREARERLQGLEKEYPYATWLPVICQNPAEIPPFWQDLCGASRAGVSPTPQKFLQRAGETPTPQKVLYNSPERLQNINSKAGQTPTSQEFLQKFSDRAFLKKPIQTLLMASVAVTALVMGGRYLGMLQGWELQAFDQLMRSRPQEPPDRRLLIVTVTEEDFQLPSQNPRTGSISDLALARLLDKLAQFKPRAIGLDIYRDYPAKTGTNLAARMRKDNNFFAICKASDRTANIPGISPPAHVPPERLGFSDVVKDTDGILRRHLLAMEPESSSPCTTSYALSAQLAFHYLKAEGISAQYSPKGDLQIGNIVVKRLQKRMGGYQTVDSWGYQILLNYRSYHSPETFARIVTLADVLNGKLNPEYVRDRIVLIGVTAQSTPDYIFTPFSAGKDFYQGMPGVIVQAQMVSQILSAVKDGRPLLSVWPVWGEIVWIWSWSVVGGFVVWCKRFFWGDVKRSQLYLLLLEGTALGVLFLVCYILFVQGKWVPLVPSALGLVLTGSCVAFYSKSQAGQKQFILTSVNYESEPEKAKI
jgi:CHASE2 domain-containing sensor protein